MVNNYIQIDINGKKVGLKFAFPQARDFQIALAENPLVYFDGDNLSETGIAKIIHSAYKNNCLLKEVKPEFTFEEIANWVDESFHDEERKKVIAEVLEVWSSADHTKLLLESLKKKNEALQSLLQEIQSNSNMNESKQPSMPTELPEGS